MNDRSYDIYGRPIIVQDVTTTTSVTGLVTAKTTKKQTLSVETGVTSGTKLQVVNVTTGDILVDNVGSYTASTGKVSLVGFKSDEGKVIKLSVLPANASAIVPEREYILAQDNTRLSAKGLSTTATN